MTNSRPYALSIAGFDPSGGAGILADIKTFENIGVYGFGVCSALTYQNDEEFIHVDWIDLDKIKEQILVLFKRFKIDFIKIGLIENFSVLLQLVKWIRSKNPEVKIIWDPILKASAGFEFHSVKNYDILIEILKNINLLTPNIPEMKLLYSFDEAEKNALEISRFCKVYLKGGHTQNKIVTDILFLKNEQLKFDSKKFNNHEKHGSGCVLSAAILANLAKGKSIEVACKLAKKYTEHFLLSNTTLLGYHNN